MIGAGWMVYGLSLCPAVVWIPLGVAGLVSVGWLLRRAQALIGTTGNTAAAEPAARAASRRIWKWFWLNLVVEIVLLNVAVNVLSAPEQRIYWIAAISCVVGLHFLPMAVFMDVPSYWLCGGAMIALALAAAAALAWFSLPGPGVVAAESIGNAFILWATVAWGVRTYAG